MIEVFTEMMSSVCHVYDADYRDFKKLHERGAEKELLESVELLL